jgi:hypothetical protein
MNKTTKDELANKFKELLDQWEKNPERMQSGLNYEKSFVEMMRQFEQEVFQKSLGDLPKDKNFKKK